MHTYMHQGSRHRLLGHFNVLWNKFPQYKDNDYHITINLYMRLIMRAVITTSLSVWTTGVSKLNITELMMNIAVRKQS